MPDSVRSNACREEKTNNAPLYRVPVWTAIAAQADLKIRLPQLDHEVVAKGRRPKEWTSSVGQTAGLDIAAFRTCRVGHGERLYYAPMQSAGQVVRSADAVLLGAWGSAACWQLSSAAKRRKIRRVGFYESTRLSQRHQLGAFARARARFFRAMNTVVVPGPAAAGALLDLGVSSSRIVEGFDAVDVGRFAAVAGSHPEGPGHRYLYIGQLIDRKNVDGLLEALAWCARNGDTLTIAGDGIRREQLESTTRELQIPASVQFIGHVALDKIPELLAAHHTLVLPSREEVWGLVVNEALSAGRHAVVSTRAGVARSVEGMTGAFLSDPSAQSLAETMAHSRDTWTSPINESEILAYTPTRFAEAFLYAFRSGM